MPTNLPTPPRAIACGVDISMTYTGIAVVDEHGDISTFGVRSAGHRGDSLADQVARLHGMADSIEAAVPATAHVVVEGPAFHTKTSGAHSVAGLWWLVVTALVLSGRPVHIVPPANLKQYATGVGNAPKDEVLAAVVKRYPAALVVNNNVADAVALMAMGARHLEQPVEGTLPARNLAALTKVAWAA